MSKVVRAYNKLSTAYETVDDVYNDLAPKVPEGIRAALSESRDRAVKAIKDFQGGVAAIGLLPSERKTAGGKSR